MPEQKEKKKATRETSWGRWQIIGECQIPTVERVVSGGGDKASAKSTPMCAYIVGGKTKWMSPAIVKSVLLELGRWDDGGSQIIDSVPFISHRTQIPARSIGNALAALRQVKILKRIPRGIHQTPISVLDWNVIESHREKWKSETANTDTAPIEEETDPVQDVPVSPALAISDSLAEEILDSPLAEKLTPEQAAHLAGAICKKVSGIAPLLAFARLSDVEIANAYKANTPAAYLRSRVEAKIREMAEQNVLTPNLTDQQLEGVIEEVESGERVEAVYPTKDPSTHATTIDAWTDRLRQCGNNRILVGTSYISHDPEGTALITPLAPMGGEMRHDRKPRNACLVAA